MNVSFAPAPYRDSLRPLRDLLATLLPELRRDLDHAETEHGSACGLVVMTNPRPDDLLLYELGGATSALHAACPLFVVRSVALHYAPTFVQTLWQRPPPDAVWCLVLSADRATVVSLQGARIRPWDA